MAESKLERRITLVLCDRDVIGSCSACNGSAKVKRNPFRFHILEWSIEIHLFIKHVSVMVKS